MTDHEHVDSASELVYASRPSWAPAFLAAGLTIAIMGIFSHFLLPGWFYIALGVVVILAALRSIVLGTIRDYYHLPQRQKVRGAVLPAPTFRLADRD